MPPRILRLIYLIREQSGGVLAQGCAGNRGDSSQMPETFLARDGDEIIEVA